jgi:hypothetical protein
LIEDIAGGVLRALSRVLLWLLLDVLIDIVIYGYGYITLKIFTLGRYPKQYGAERNFSIFAGVVAILATACFIVYWQNLR